MARAAEEGLEQNSATRKKIKKAARKVTRKVS
jgi:hypothetical protein